MSQGKSGEGRGSQSADSQENAPRARNRTVMLTPDITSQVRARLSRKVEIEELPEETEAESDQEQINQDATESIALPYEEDQNQTTEEYSAIQDEELLAADPIPGYEDINYSEEPTFEEGPSDVPEEEPVNPIMRQIHQVSSDEKEHAHKEQARYEDPAEQDSYVPQRRSTSLNLRADKEAGIKDQDVPAEKKTISSNREKAMFRDMSGSNSVELVWTKMAPVIGFLVSFDQDVNGEVLFLRPGRLLVTSEAPNAGSFMLIHDESVSPMHAIMRITEDGQIQLLDNLSEYGTSVIKRETGEELTLSGEKTMLFHGDLVKFGSRCFSLCMIGG